MRLTEVLRQMVSDFVDMSNAQWWDTYVGLPDDKRTDSALKFCYSRMATQRGGGINPILIKLEDMGYKTKSDKNAHKLILENPQIVSDDENSTISIRYNRSRLSSKEDITTVGKYINMHYEVPDHVVRDLVASYQSEHFNAFEITNDANLMVKYVQVGPKTCMKTTSFSYETHPVRVYKPEFGWSMCIRKKRGMVVGRAFIHESTSGKFYVRTYKAYGDDPNSNDTSQADEAMEGYLNSNGYKKVGSWPVGTKIGSIGGENFLTDAGPMGPYVDGSIHSFTVISETEMVSCHDDSATHRLSSPHGTMTLREVSKCTECGTNVLLSPSKQLPPADSSYTRYRCAPCIDRHKPALCIRNNRCFGESARNTNTLDLVSPIAVEFNWTNSRHQNQIPEIMRVKPYVYTFNKIESDSVTRDSGYVTIRSGKHAGKADLESNTITVSGYMYHIQDIGESIIDVTPDGDVVKKYVTRAEYLRTTFLYDIVKHVNDKTESLILERKPILRSKKKELDFIKSVVCSEEDYLRYKALATKRNVKIPAMYNLNKAKYLFVCPFSKDSFFSESLTTVYDKTPGASTAYALALPKNCSLAMRDTNGAWSRIEVKDGVLDFDCDCVTKITETIYIVKSKTISYSDKPSVTYETILEIV